MGGASTLMGDGQRGSDAGVSPRCDHPPVNLARHDLTPGELTRMLAAERGNGPFLAFRNAETDLDVIELEGERVVIGRDAGNDLVLPWDVEVSRVHAMLERLAGAWTVVDDDLSRNGTFVNGQRVRGRRRLNDRDVVRVGATELLYRDPAAEAGETVRASGTAAFAGITPSQQRVLVALCRPLLDSPEPGATPPSNAELAGDVGISTEAVRSHMKTLFKLFEIPDLPQNRKRAELARRALAAGVVGPHDLSD
jgi:pSer/pThr/pTyr-binding forkhead associated (FHA) protein